MIQNEDDQSQTELIRLMEVFSGDGDLANWFLELQRMADTARSSHLSSMAEGMKVNRERPDLIAAVEALRAPEMFRTTMRAVQSLNR